MRHVLLLSLGAAALVAACDKGRSGYADTSAKAQPVGQSTATAAAAPASATTAGGVKITSPANGGTTGKDVTVTLQSQGVKIAKADGSKVEGVGHYHLFLDTTVTADSLPIPPTSSKIVHIGSGDSSYTFKNLPAGPHRLIAVIGYGNHAPMPNGRDTVNFTVKK
jgi:hypothetical protein